MRWVLVTFIAIIVLTSACHGFKNLVSALPGDLNFRIFGKDIQIPLASTILITLVLMAIAKFL